MHVCREIRKYVVGKVEREAIGGVGKLFERGLGIYLVFVSVFLWKWADVLARSFWLLSEMNIWLLCRNVRILECHCHSVCLLIKGAKSLLPSPCIDKVDVESRCRRGFCIACGRRMSQ